MEIPQPMSEKEIYIRDRYGIVSKKLIEYGVMLQFRNYGRFLNTVAYIALRIGSLGLSYIPRFASCSSLIIVKDL